MKILVVEDEPACLKLAGAVLAGDGHDVEEASAVAHAFDQINLNAPELILLDLALPDIDGLTLARAIKGNPELRHIVIVAVTAFPEKYRREEALAAGCDAYIVKPLNTRKLTGLLSRAVENRERGTINESPNR